MDYKYLKLLYEHINELTAENRNLRESVKDMEDGSTHQVAMGYLREVKDLLDDLQRPNTPADMLQRVSDLRDDTHHYIMEHISPPEPLFIRSLKELYYAS